MKDWKYYKKKEYSQLESQQMDYELDVIYELVTSLYNMDVNAEPIKEALDKIQRVVYSK